MVGGAGGAGTARGGEGTGVRGGGFTTAADGAGAGVGVAGGAAGGLVPGGPTGAAGLAVSTAGAGAVGGGDSSTTAGGGLGGRVPGGAASSTGAPHCSQKSPDMSNGPLQKRQSTAPGWVTRLSNAFLRASSSISVGSRPRLGRGNSTGGPARGVNTGDGEIFRAMVDCGVGRGRLASTGRAGADSCAGGSPMGVLASAAGVSGEAMGATGAPH